MKRMLVWVASFPRSGNTFLRVVLKTLYGVRTTVVYDVDGVAERLGAGVVGFYPRPTSITEMREDSQVHFIKTHRRRDTDVEPGDAAICLVRDGRDALVSWARQASEDDPAQYEARLGDMILRTTATGTGSWGSNVLSWLQPGALHRPVLTYERLVADPEAAVHQLMSVVAPQTERLPGAQAPDFENLRTLDGRFFRRGVTGSYVDEMPRHLQDLFWAQTDNAAAMQLLRSLSGPG